MKFKQLDQFLSEMGMNRDIYPPAHDDYTRDDLHGDEGVAGDPEISLLPNRDDFYPNTQGVNDIENIENLEDMDFDIDDEELDELAEKITRKWVVRGGEKKRKISTDKKGFKILNGREVKMDPAELKARKKGGKRAFRKIKNQKGSILRKRAMSLRRKKSV